MSRRSFIWRDGRIWERGTEPPLPRGPRSDLAAPAVRSDGMEPIRSMLDGRMYDGKGAYYASLRAAGAEIVGDDKAPFDKKPTFEPKGVGQSIKNAIEQLGG